MLCTIGMSAVVMPCRSLAVVMEDGQLRSFLFGKSDDHWRCVGAPPEASHLEGQPAEMVKAWLDEQMATWEWVI